MNIKFLLHFVCFHILTRPNFHLLNFPKFFGQCFFFFYTKCNNYYRMEVFFFLTWKWKINLHIERNSCVDFGITKQIGKQTLNFVWSFWYPFAQISLVKGMKYSLKSVPLSHLLKCHIAVWWLMEECLLTWKTYMS